MYLSRSTDLSPSVSGHFLCNDVLTADLGRKFWGRTQDKTICKSYFLLVAAGQDTRIRFSVMPCPGDSGFTQWHDAMKMVARLPGGIPPEFRRRVRRT